MNLKELRELVEFIIAKDIAEFELERGDLKVRIRRSAEPAAPVMVNSSYPAAPAPPIPAEAIHAAVPPAGSPAAAAPVATEEGLHEVRSPIVGTFYEGPSPGAPPFVKVGETVELGQVLCIIEAMKLMNEIEADVAGEIVKKLVTNGQPVEYGQPLFLIRPPA